jgi:tRNA(fMet)-specific endonuclease VapC
LDTNILRYWFDQDRPEHGTVVQRIESLAAESPLRVSAVSLGEIEYGHRCVSDTDSDIQRQYNDFLAARVPSALSISRNTATYYGELRENLFEKFAPNNAKRKPRPCQLVDPVTAKTLGIQENDLWIAAQAMEYNLVLVTHDKMRHIHEVKPGLLDFEDWAA